MVRILFIPIILLMLFASEITAQSLSGDNFSEAKASKKAVVTFTYVETPGFAYKDASGKLTGVCVDIMNDFMAYVAKNHGIQMNARYVGNGSSFSAMFDGVKNGSKGVFGLGNVTVTEARKSQIKFSPAFITNFAILVTHSSVPTLSSMEEISTVFKGFTGYTAKGTLNEKRVNQIKSKFYPELKISYINSSPAVLDKILSDPKSFSYLDLAFYLNAVKERKPLKRHQVGDDGSEDFAFIMPLSSDWQPIMEEFFAANDGYKNSTEYKKILVNHLGLSAVKLLDSAR
ncbi:transporter substrate-binding domain-containing protein [Marivirga sp. S37H4]|uniref:Transporter substrate-binding domain-containing protein n=1 Tax=Marivirga aurantiaca TaxID=2802615 RepID=A0A935C7C2_9BACT|nr:transporter substrate-binding domain-containing protein [Marivirga aurantiaca]MBK6264835.1 transporter substrate-binding domain-containing protein [Marivirga aurantiaca]